jgi:DNA-binding transcriptional MerR regulator
MLTIGAFARLGGVSPRTLRHYETVGILRPDSTDAATGYRFYRADQLARLHRIQALQDLGLSLQQLEPLLDDGISGEQLSGMLAMKREELAERVAADRGRLERVETRLRYIELEDDMSLDLVIKTIPATRVAQIRYAGEEGLDFYNLTEFASTAAESLREVLSAASIKRVGPVFMQYEDRPDGTLTPIFAVPIGDQPLSEADGIEMAELPSVEAVVTIYRGKGDHDLIGPLYGQMARYAEDHGYSVHGPGRDNILSYDDSGEMVFELQLPVTRELQE